MAATGWLALGPIGTGALGLLLLGADAPRVFSAVDIPGVGEVGRGIGLLGGTIFWGYGAWWFLLAVMTTIRYLREGLPFNIGWWGFTFPIGVYAVATLALARQTHLAPLFVFGAVLVAALVAFWCVVAFRTARGALDRSLFVARLASSQAPFPATSRQGASRTLLGTARWHDARTASRRLETSPLKHQVGRCQWR